MINRELAKVLRQMGVFLEMEETPFKPAAYERAALSVEALDKDVAEIFSRGGRQSLKQIPGVGEGIAKTIEEYLKTGQITYLSRLKKKIPVDLDNLLAVEGIGPKTIKELWDKLRIKNLDDLEKAAEAKKIRKLANFGEKSEQNILQGIEFVRRSHGRFLLGEILPEIEQVLTELRRLEQVEKADIAGSLRRGKETIGDADILVISKNPQKVTDFFVSLPDIVKIWGQGTTKASIRTKQGFDIDLRIIPKKSYGAALQYFTGSKEHNIATRKIAIEKGLKLNEYGLFRGKKMIASSQEQDIYKALGLSYIEPELREDQGEIESALQQFQGKLPGLPKLITNKDVLGDLHCHSHWDGGRDSILEMARTAMSLGYQYIGIADHTKFLRIEHGLDEKQLLRQNREIKSLNSKFQSTNSKQIPNSNFQIPNSPTNYQLQSTNYLDGFAIGRASFGRPWIFGKGKNQNTDNRIQVTELKKNILDHAKLTEKSKGERGIVEFRKHLLQYLKGFKNAKILRLEAVKITKFEDVKKIIGQISE